MKNVVQTVKQKFDTMGFTSCGPPNPIGLSQNEQECLIWCCLESNHGGHWMEIGTYTGGSAVLMCMIRQMLYLPPCVYSVDVTFDRRDGLFDKNMHKFDLQHMSRKLKCNSKNIVLDPETQLDFVFIDGHHSFRYCVWDFLTVGPYIHDDTIIAFHDTSPNIHRNSKEHIANLDRHIKQNYDAMMAVTIPPQDYRIDEAIRYICQNYNYELLDIPCRTDTKELKDSLPTKWVRGLTSPFNALAAIRKKKHVT